MKCDLTKLGKGRIGVIGDFCLDVYWHADMTRSELSRETPHFPLPIVQERLSPGGAGNVVANLLLKLSILLIESILFLFQAVFSLSYLVVLIIDILVMLGFELKESLLRLEHLLFFDVFALELGFFKYILPLSFQDSFADQDAGSGSHGNTEDQTNDQK